MANLFEPAVNHNTICFACGSLVYAVEKKITTHHVYHNRCFRCRICKRNLTGFSLNEEGDDIYCGNCYRRKQRGDCNSFEFYRAAAEKAQYVHNRHHPDHPKPLLNPTRSVSYRETARNPSLTLRQLERQFLSHQPSPSNSSSNNNSVASEHSETNRKSLSLSHPLTINTNFSTPVNLSQIRRDPSLTKEEASPRHFTSSFTTVRSEATVTPRVIQKPNETIINDEQTKSTGGIEFRLNKSSIDLSHIISPRTERKNIIVPDLNPDSEPKEPRYRYPDFHIAAIRRRSSSANHHKTALRVD